jgi:hypothetical protein
MPSACLIQAVRLAATTKPRRTAATTGVSRLWMVRDGINADAYTNGPVGHEIAKEVSVKKNKFLKRR